MIGIFDSGVGGLAIWRELDSFLPQIDLIYLADTAAFPYGTRSRSWLENRASSITRFLISRGCRLVVVACNTATAVAIAHLRSGYHIPFVGVEPPFKVAASRKDDRRPVFVLMTENTALSEKYGELVEKYGKGVSMRTVRLPMLAQVVQDGTFTSPRVAASVAETVRVAIGSCPEGARLVLGCTHYVFLKSLLQKALGAEFEFLDPCGPVARQTLRVMQKEGIPASGGGQRIFCATSSPQSLARACSALLGLRPPAVELVTLL